MRATIVTVLTLLAVLISPVSAQALDYTQARLTIDPAAAPIVPLGADVLATGILEGLSDGVWQPISDQEITLYVNGYDSGSPPRTAPTGDDGRFSFSIPATTRISYWAQWRDPVDQKIHNTPTRTVQVQHPRSLTFGSFYYLPEGEISAHARVTGFEDDPSFELQFSRDGSTEWTTVKQVEAVHSEFDIWYASALFPWTENGYWRWIHPGTSMTTPAERAFREPTKVKKFKVSKKTARYNARIEVSGALRQWKQGRWVPFADREAQVLYACKADQEEILYEYGLVTTNALGRFTKTVRAKCTGQVFVTYHGEDGFFSATSARRDLEVTGAPAA